MVFEKIRNEDSSAILKLLLHNYIPDQTLFRALGSAKRLEYAMSNPEARESQAFLRETYEFLEQEIIRPSLDSEPIVSFKAVCQATGEIIGVTFGKVLKLSEYSPLSFLKGCTIF